MSIFLLTFKVIPDRPYREVLLLFLKVMAQTVSVLYSICESGSLLVKKALEYEYQSKFWKTKTTCSQREINQNTICRI